MESVSHLMAVMLVMAAATFLTRALPFWLFSKVADHPLLDFLGRYLPPMLMVLLLVYSFKNEDFMSLGFLPELAGLAITFFLHVTWRQPLVSILLGTAAYMILVQTAWLG